MNAYLTGWTDRLTPQQLRMTRVVYFMTRLIILSLPLYLVMWLGVDLYFLEITVASQSAWLLHILGFSVMQQGTMITANGFLFSIIADCTGWKSMFLLFALMFAVPGITIKKRLLGLCTGLPQVWMANLGRVIGVVGIQAIVGTETALFLHDTIFQAGLLLSVLSIWVGWYLWATGNLYNLIDKFPRIKKNLLVIKSHFFRKFV